MYTPTATATYCTKTTVSLNSTVGTSQQTVKFNGGSSTITTMTENTTPVIQQLMVTYSSGTVVVLSNVSVFT